MLIPLIVAATLSCDVAVVGGGSAGFAAALAAAENGSDTILIEKEAILGGTSTICGVNNWEPVCGATGTSKRVYERLAAIPGACGIWYQESHSSFGDSFPGAFLKIDDTLTYEDTLRRHGPSMSADVADWQARYHGIVFEPDELDGVMRQMLAETGRCRVFTSVAYSSCAVREGKIAELRLSNGKVIRPKVVIDACGFVAKDAGCASEMSANPNSVTLLFRVSSEPDAPEIAVPEDTPDTCWWATSFPVVFCVEYPNGDRNVNMLPTMTGSEAAQLGPEAAYAECLRRVFAQWKWMKKTYPLHFGDFKITEVFPRLGYRETHRIVCEHMLTGAEVKAGTHFEDEIATADHAFDSHGASTAYSGELSQPYGIPLRSLKPLGVRNLYVAGRIAGFDAAAASSCRLSRTMMELGAAAGKAAAADAAGELRPVDIRVDGTNAVITVGAGVVEDGEALWLGYGPSDGGASIEGWAKKLLVAESMSAAGGTYEVAIPARREYQAVYLRAFAIRGSQLVALRTDNQAYIDLNETPVPGRRYEIRFSYANWDREAMCFLFGGVGRTGGSATSMFQVYSGGFDRGYFFFAGSQSDANGGSCPLFDSEQGKVMDVRIDYGASAQSYYYKAADTAEYAKAGDTAIDHETAGYKNDLYLFARNDDGAKFSSKPVSAFVTVYGYKVTDISTGAVVKNLVPRFDGQGRGEMVDTVTDTPCPNAGSGAFAAVYDGGREIASQLACYEGVRIEAISSRTLQVTVDPGISDGDERLMLCWGGTDKGMSLGAWEHSVSLCDTVPVEGFAGTASCRRLDIKPTDVVRAVLVPCVTYRHADACRSAGGAIDLGMAVAGGRQYDMRCKFNTLIGGVPLFGGLVRNAQTGNKIFQLYLIDDKTVQIWLGDATASDFFSPERDELYDIRIILGDGEQKAYVKKASESEYALKVTANVADGVSTGIHLALLGRYDGTGLQPIGYNNGYCFYFNQYKETDLETGKVIRELVPVRYGANDAQTGIYDVTQGRLHDGVSGSLAFSTTYLQEFHAYGDATGVSSPFQMPEPNQGLVLMLR